eukprot:GFUD01047796.1.p1 GENE.GFUD01047796.1~~GFUD01047796.1.p1  ORF type:complete len:223 (-),score=51.49 GFUD01047796.1:176-808(-)
MAVFERCCCCSLRTGCLVFGTLGLVMALVNIGLAFNGFVSYELATEEELHGQVDEILKVVEELENLKSQVDGEVLKEIEKQLLEIQDGVKILQSEGTIENVAIFLKVSMATRIVSVLQSVVSITTYSLLIYGIHQAKYKFILPTLLWNPINVCIDVIIIILYTTLFDLALHIVIITTAVYAIVSLLCWLCVFSHWRMVKVQVGAPEKLEL